MQPDAPTDNASAERVRSYRATADEMDVWLATPSAPASGRYNLSLDIEFRPRVDVPALRAAVAAVVAAHPRLRSAFAAAQGDLIRHEWEELPLVFLHERRASPYVRADALEWASSVASLPFELASPPLVRSHLLEAEDGALLVLCMHHIVSDGRSLEIILGQIVAGYEAARYGASPEFAPEPAGDAATACAPDARQFWAELLADAGPQLSPPLDFVPDAEGPPSVCSFEIALREADHRAVRALAVALHASPATIVAAVWALILHAWSGDAAGTFGMLFSGRLYEQEEDAVGLFARVLPIVTRAAFDEPFSALVARIRDRVIEALEHSQVGVDDLAGLRHERSRKGHRDTCVFLHLPEVLGEWRIAEEQLTVVEHAVPGGKHDLALAALEGPDWIRLQLDVDTGLFHRATAEAMLAQIVALIGVVVRDSELPCGRALELCEAGAAVRGPGATPRVRSVAERVVDAAAAAPERIAVRHGAAEASYGDLLAEAMRVARLLEVSRIGPGHYVATALPRSIGAITTILGIVLSGAAYLPLDPEYPDEALQRIVGDARPRLVVVRDEDVARFRAAGAPVESLTRMRAAADGLPRTHPGADRPRPERTLNLLYTSGSTGTPKGVVLPQRGLARLLGAGNVLDITAVDVVGHLSPLNFDGSSFEIWGALAHGAELVVLDKEVVLDPRALRAEVRRHGITTLVVTTPLFNRIVDDVPDLLTSLRRICVGGELVSVPHVATALRWSRPGTLLHTYGPTENSFTSARWPMRTDRGRERTLPIGRAVEDTTTHVVLPGTSYHAPAGAEGELLLGGDGLAHGYLGDPRMSAARFVPDPFATASPGGRLYRTGDRVRRLPSGDLEFIGRVDQQVKVRSQRVELGEVEAVLNAHPAVAAAVVVAQRDPEGQTEIVAYVVLEPRSAGAEAVREHAGRMLPRFAVPRFLIPVDEIPLTRNGKIDRARLPSPRSAAAAAAAQPAHRDGELPVGERRHESMLERVRAAWEDVLGHGAFADDDNFFDAGGHSLLLVRLQDRLQTRTGAHPTMAQLVRHTTVRAQVEAFTVGVP